MTRVVLDTNSLIWLVVGDDNLGTEAKELVQNAILDQVLYVSAFSFWEIGMLAAKERLRLERPLTEWRRGALSQGIEEIPLTGGVAMLSTQLEGLPNDPADRIITTTAMVIEGKLVTSDRELLRWEGDLQRHDARR